MKHVGFLCLCFGLLKIAATCQSSWEPFNNSCYYAGSANQLMTFIEAKKYCQRLLSHLVEIDSIEEQAFLQTLISKTHSQHDFWIGADDSTTEGRFIWSGSKHQLVYTNWCPGEPNNALIGEDCVEINVNGMLTNYCWNDDNCNTHHYCICETRDLPSTTELTTSEATTGQLIWRTIA